MLLARSKNRSPKPTHAAIANAVKDVSAKALREYVELLTFPRHYVVEKAANVRARDLLVRLLLTKVVVARAASRG